MTTPTTDLIIGRDADIARVSQAVTAGQPLLIVGEPGIGKTALARAGVRASGITRVWEGGGITTLDWVSYLPYRRALGLPLPDGDATVVADFIADHAEQGAFIIDDLQWVDHDTVSATAFLAERAPVVAISRPIPHGEDIRAQLVDARFDVIELGPLAEPDAVRLAVAQNPSLTPATARAVAARASGNPLLIQGLAHAREDTAELALALRARLGELSPAARKALHRVAVLERPARLQVAPDDLRQLVDMGLVTETREGVQVRHDLIARAVLENVSPVQLRELHRVVAQRIDAPGEAARHWAAAGERVRARELALEAARTAERDVEGARCAALAAQCLEGPVRDRELVAAMQRLANLGDFTTVLSLSHDVPEGSPWEPEALRLRGRALFDAQHSEEAAAALAAAASAARRLHDEAAELRARITTTFHDVWSRTGDGSLLAWIERAEELGAADAEMYVSVAAAIMWDNEAAAAVSLSRRAREAALREGNPWAEQESWVIEALGLNHLGRWPEAVETTRRGEAELAAKGRHLDLARIRVSRADQMALECNFELVLELTAELLARPVLLGRNWDMAVWSRAVALHETGRTAHGEALLAELDGRVLPDDGEYNGSWLHAEMLLSRGDGWGAIPLAEHAKRVAPNPRLVLQVDATIARAQWECDLPIASPDTAPRYPPDEEHVAEITGLAALQAGDPAGALAAFRHAQETGSWRRYQVRYRLGHFEALDLVNPDRATTELEELVRDLREIGWVPLLERVEPLLHATPGGRRLRANPQQKPNTLTQREHDTLALVAEGLTTRQIADRLGVSPATVESHVRGAMRKLGAKTRAEAAAALGPQPPQR